jgi:hypothetical protein
LAGGRKPLVDMTTREVTAVLQSTGSTDPDVLFAAKAELGRPFERQRMYGLLAIVAGLAMGAAIASRILAIPFVLAAAALLAVGNWCRRKGTRNLATIDVAYRMYSSARRHDER